jgi:hypothetical protein
VRVFAANIVAGGVGLNLTAARQVVFNDLDWVPANHWQAEDRAYRIGQANSVHVAYMCAEETIDEFVASVLRIKEGIIEAVVEGEALGEFGGDVLGELERLLAAVSPGMADYGTSRMDAGAVAEMMRKMRDMVKAGDSGAGTGSGFSGSGSGAGEGDSGSGSGAGAGSSGAGEGDSGSGAGAGAGARHSAAMEAAMRLLEQALMGEEVVRYRVASNSRPGESYELEVDAGGDVVCSCPGFGYRGQCSHGRTLKAALARRGGLPKGYEAVAE